MTQGNPFNPNTQMFPPQDSEPQFPQFSGNSPSGKTPVWVLPAIAIVAILAVAAVIITWMISSGDNDSDAVAESTAPVFTSETTTVQQVPSTAVPAPTAAESVPVPEAPAASAGTGNTLVTESGHYGVGLAATEACGSAGTQASYVLVGAGSAQCNFALDVGDELAGTTVREGSSRSLSVYSTNRNEYVDLSCVKAQDSDLDFLWKCTTEYNSIVYVYP